MVYEHADTHWAVIRLRKDDGDTVAVVGNLAPVFAGERLEIHGDWVEDARFGRQFRARSAMRVRPGDAAAIERYLASGVVPGIGPELAARIVARFGDGALDVLDETPDELLAVRGIGKVRLARIKETWREQAAERGTRMFLQGLGLGPFMIGRILRAWGKEAEQRIRSDPYALAASDEIAGIGFRRADLLARQLPGWAADALSRAGAAVDHVLDQEADRGHCFVPFERLVRLSREVLQLDDEAPVRASIDAMLESGRLVDEQLDEEEIAALSPSGASEPEVAGAADEPYRAVYKPAFHDAERRVARRLARIHAMPARDGLPGGLSADRVDKAVRWVERQQGIELGDDQREALHRALSSKIVVVTGGPGTGKTTLIDAVVRCGLAAGGRIALAAPTGRAAKRLSEATGHDARTVHRLLEYRPRDGGFARGVDYPLDADVVIVDEASMIDLFLMDALVAAVPLPAVLVLVGDADQLPPVGPGAVLRDLLAAGVLPTVRLQEIYRQAQRSLIVRNAHRINRGQLPLGLEQAPPWDGDEPNDFYFIAEEDADRARELALALVARRIPERFGLDPRRDIQVLAPMHRGKAGVAKLNRVLQQQLNPGAGGRKVGEQSLRPADRVLQQRNDYDRDVFNGDVGTVVAAAEDGDVVVEFDGRRVAYDAESARNLTLAYAISVHKSQGSEYPAVVVLLLPEHYPMLQRNLLYTALTRAQRLAVLVGSRRAVGMAVRNAAPRRRCTRLARRLAQRPTPLPREA